MELFAIFFYYGDSWSDENGRIYISYDFFSRSAAEAHARAVKKMLGCKADIVSHFDRRRSA